VIVSFSSELTMSKSNSRGRLALVATLCLPPAVPALLSDAEFRGLVPEPPRRGRIGVAGTIVVVGVRDYIDAVEGGEREVNVTSMVEADEDLAVIGMLGAKDLQPEMRNALALGRTYALTEQAISKLPKRNTERDRADHKRKYGVRRAERLNAMWKEVFGVSKTNLRRYARVLVAPAEVRRLFLAGQLRLDEALMVADADAELERNVERDLLAGVPVGEVMRRYFGDGARKNNGDETPQIKQSVVGLVKSLNRWGQVFEPVKDPPLLTREQDRDLEKGEQLISRLRRKVV
jgi:hypothetical protein